MSVITSTIPQETLEQNAKVQEKLQQLNDTIKGIQSHVTFNGIYYPSTG